MSGPLFLLECCVARGKRDQKRDGLDEPGV